MTTPRKKVPLGKAIIWSQAELTKMSTVTPIDVRLARLWWRKHAPAKYRRLLDAVSAKQVA